MEYYEFVEGLTFDMAFYAVFTAFVIGVSFFFKLCSLGTNANLCKKTYIFFIGIVLCFVMGARSFYVGVDTKAYEYQFYAFGERALDADFSIRSSGYPVYRILCKIVYTLFGKNYQVLLFVTAFIIVCAFMSLIYEYSSDVYYTTMLLVVYYLYFNAWNGSRQFIAISFTIFSIIFATGKKIKLSIIFILLAFLTHTTSLIMLIFYPIYYIKWDKKKVILFLFMFICFVSIGIEIIPNILRFFPRYQALYLDVILTNDMSVFGGVPKGRKVLVSIFALICIWGCLIYKRKSCKYTSINWILLIFAWIEIIIGIICRHNSALLRLQMYFSPYLVVSMINMIDETRFTKQIRNVFKTGVVVILLIPYFIQINENYGGINPYGWFNQ